MQNRQWIPHMTVATVVFHDGRYLLVEELDDGCHVLNQPAGHLEADETLIDAAARETLEETGWEVQIEAVLGASLSPAVRPASVITAPASWRGRYATMQHRRSTKKSSLLTG